jgi:hypothetical protein
MNHQDRQRQKLEELRQQWGNLSDRIAAIVKQLGVTTDAEQTLVLNKRRQALEDERDGLEPEIQRLEEALGITPEAPPAGARHIGPPLAEQPQAAPGPIKNRWALLVGVNRYVDPAFPPLRYCVSDVLALAETLKDLGYTVVTLRDEAPEEHLLPSRDNVEAELARLCQVAGPDDLLWVHFSCHGKLVNGQPVLITRETRAPTLVQKALPLAEVERRMRGSRARRLALTLDACHTGVEIGRDLADSQFIRNAYDLAEGFALIAASTSQQIAQEWNEKEHGVFTYYLLEGLSGQADRAGKSFVTVNDLTTHTLDGLRRWNVEHGGLLQEPTARTEGLGDMILADYRNPANFPAPSSFSEKSLDTKASSGTSTRAKRDTTKPAERSASPADVLTIRLDHDGHPHQPGPGQWWMRLMVESEKPLSGCWGQIYDIRRLKDPNDPQGEPWHELHRSMLSWAQGTGLFAPISLRPYVTEYLDLAWRAGGDPPIPEHQLRVASALDPGPRDTKSPDWGMRQDFIPLEPGYYLLVIRILSEDYGTPLERRYHLHWPGPGQEDGIRLSETTENIAKESHARASHLASRPSVDQGYSVPLIPRKIDMPNPFGDTGRITDPDRFFDREELLRQIFEELGKGGNISLVGESQIGKSSLLTMVCALGPERLDMPPKAVAYLSMEWVDDEDDFYQGLCDRLGIESCRGYKLTRALRGRHYVLCLDEIEKMGWDHFGFTVRVRSQLRGLADGPAAPLKLVIASRSPLARLFPDSPELDSPLAGICHQLDVGPFPLDVARAFLAHRLRGTGVVFSEDQIGALLAESDGHPAKLQRAATDLYHRITRHASRST